MDNDRSTDDVADRRRDTQADRETNHSNSNSTHSGDTTRERIAWGLFALLVGYVGLHPILPTFVPDPAIVGAIVTGLVSLLAARALSTGGGR